MTDYRTVPVALLNEVEAGLYLATQILAADRSNCAALNETRAKLAALSASSALASGDLVERVESIIRANMPGAPHDLASVNRTARAVIAAMQPVGWASEWQGLGGLARALHDTKEAADDNAEWMDGRSFALYALPAPPGVGS